MIVFQMVLVGCFLLGGCMKKNGDVKNLKNGDVFRVIWKKGDYLDFVVDKAGNASFLIYTNDFNTFGCNISGDTNSYTTSFIENGVRFDVYDFNGDGIPDMRKSQNGRKTEVFIDIEIYEAQRTNGAWLVGGKVVKFDGKKWSWVNNP
ncbi:MAG: hypothetical protein PHV34_20075 [Verrucomicrobiae bacterium]|nr:hypothetical protein [Verrucomicrobiae bacterium]